jgi:diguanylate cyclase (GGDEF)-like protein
MAAHLRSLRADDVHTADHARDLAALPRSARAATNGHGLGLERDLERDVAASGREIGAMRSEIEELRLQGATLRQKLALLEHAVVKARALAHHDELTGLPNRRLLVEHFNHAVARANRQHKQTALLFVDLDGFKKINDAFGHALGDRLLEEVAARLLACVRASDTPCRLGGDEFIVLLPDQECRATAMAAAEHIRAALAAPYRLDGVTIAMTASIGVAVYPLDGQAYGDLIRFADREMYFDKRPAATRSAVR